MRRLLFLLLAFPMLALAQEAKIEINLSDLPEGSTVALCRMDGDVGRDVHKEKVQGGFCKFSFSCESLEENVSYTVVLLDETGFNDFGSRALYVIPGDDIILSGGGKFPLRWNIQSKSPRQAFENQLDTLCLAQRIECDEIERRALTLTSHAERTALYQKADSILDVIRDAQLDLLSTLEVNDWWMLRVSRFASALYRDPNHPIRPKMEKLYSHLSDSQKQLPAAKKLYFAIYAKTPQVGDKLQEFTLYDVNEKAYHLSDFAGKSLLLEFGSSGCGPCRMMSPVLDYLSEISNDDFEVISIFNDTKTSFAKAVEELKPTYTILYDHDGDGGVFASNKISSYPTSMVVSPEGVIEDIWQGSNDYKPFNVLNKKNCRKVAKVITKDGKTVVSNPKVASANTSLSIEQVSLYADSTVVDFVFFLPAKFSMKSSAALCYGDGQKSKVVSSTLGLDKIVDNKFGKCIRFSVTFEPLPAGVKVFDFSECEKKNCFKIEGIQL